jgi:hypothetical protein
MSSVSPGSAYGPTEHGQAAGRNPASRDANDNESPLSAKGYDERGKECNDHEDGESEP